MNTQLDPARADWISILPGVFDALARGKPVVALESTVITHGLPRPLNLEIARRLEGEVQSAGAVPATIAIVQGQVRVGLDDGSMEALALDPQAIKASRREIALALARRLTAGTTVAATMAIAHQAGIEVFSTGGIGGVHRGGEGDISADLPELCHTPVAVVCSGAKSILDLPRTFEWLETNAVPVIGWQTDELPAFFSRSSGLGLDVRVDTIGELAALIQQHWLVSPGHAVLVCVPCPAEAAMPQGEVEQAMKKAEAEAGERGVHGKAVTPFLLSRLAELTAGATLQANLALLRSNARVGAELAKALVQHRPTPS
jgi:pseudouridine-5'-phosphate glycosidase